MVNTVKLGGTASATTVGKVAHGLMTITSRDPNVPTDDEAAFAAIKAGVDLLPPGAKMFLNSAEFYAVGLTTENLEVLARFYDKYPEYAEKTFLSVKGALKANSLIPDSSPENLRRSVDACVAALRGTKKIDLFEPARVDKNVPLEQTLNTLIQLKEEGKFDHIGMSECRAETLRKAHAIHPISAVEIEVSLWSYEEETRKVIATAEELGISVIAYSPLGRGLLTGNITSKNDIPENDFRRTFDRFQDENLKHNLVILDEIKPIAAKKNISLPQLALAWVAKLGSHVIPLPGSGKAKRVVENILSGDIELTQEEQDQIADILSKHEVKGARATRLFRNVDHEIFKYSWYSSQKAKITVENEEQREKGYIGSLPEVFNLVGKRQEKVVVQNGFVFLLNGPRPAPITTVSKVLVHK